MSNLGFIVLNDLFEAGEEFVKELADLKIKDKVSREQEGSKGGRSKPKAGKTLREREPWDG